MAFWRDLVTSAAQFVKAERVLDEHNAKMAVSSVVPPMEPDIHCRPCPLPTRTSRGRRVALPVPGAPGSVRFEGVHLRHEQSRG